MKIRLFIGGDYKEGETLTLSDVHAHYLKKVLRKDAGAKVFIFNEKQEEFEGVLFYVKKEAKVKLLNLLTKAGIEQKIKVNLVFSWIKKDAASDILQKCTQIGVHGFYPIETAYCEKAARISAERAKKIIIEACEQSERNSIPCFNITLSLKKFLEKHHDKILFFCDENERFESVASLPQITSDEVFIITGPEGGFSHEERILLKSRARSYSISLGSYILKAETACVCAAFLLIRNLNLYHQVNSESDL